MAKIKITNKDNSPMFDTKQEVDYERELYIVKIANHICNDNEEVRSLIRERLKYMEIDALIKYAVDNKINLL